jgi:anti-sigma factor RsiW
MTCADRTEQLSALVDGELDSIARKDLEAHLSTCASCARQVEELRALSRTIRENASRASPDAESVRRLGESVRAERKGAGARFAAAARYALVAAAAGLLAWLLAVAWSRPGAEARLADEIVAAHVRALLADHLTDVASSDRHAVNPWFQGKVDVAVGARDHQDKGFALEGGRLDYVDGRTVAAVVYRHGPHALNLFVWATPAVGKGAGEGELGVRGYHLVHWSANGTERWIVSDADAATVKALADLARTDG